MQDTTLVLGLCGRNQLVMIKKALETFNQKGDIALFQKDIPMKWGNLFKLLWLGFKKFSNFILGLVGLQITSMLLDKEIKENYDDFQEAFEDCAYSLYMHEIIKNAQKIQEKYYLKDITEFISDILYESLTDQNDSAKQERYEEISTAIVLLQDKVNQYAVHKELMLQMLKKDFDNLGSTAKAYQASVDILEEDQKQLWPIIKKTTFETLVKDKRNKIIKSLTAN